MEDNNKICTTFANEIANAVHRIMQFLNTLESGCNLARKNVSSTISFVVILI